MHSDLFCDIPLICIGLLYNYYRRFRFRIYWYEPQIKLANVEPFNKERIGSSILESVSLTALLFIARDCLCSWSQVPTVLSIVGWRGIGAGSLNCFCSSSTRHSALRSLLPLRKVTIHCWSWKQAFKCDQYLLLYLKAVKTSQQSNNSASYMCWARKIWVVINDYSVLLKKP